MNSNDITFDLEGEEEAEESNRAEFADLAERLRQQGFEIEQCSGMGLIQMTGRLRAGEVFYLRGRYRACSLTIYASQPGAGIEETVEGNQPLLSVKTHIRPDGQPFEEFEAGCLSAVDTETVFLQLVQDYDHFQ